MKRDQLVGYLNDYLHVRTIDDASSNGLQVEGTDQVTQLSLAVDAGLAAFQGAAEAGAQMLLVHHGLFWGNPLMVTGVHQRRLRFLLDADISLYAVHLPLDFHEEVGNNATLARWLCLEETAPFGDYKGRPAGITGRLPQIIPLSEFVDQIEGALGEPVVKVWPFGVDEVRSVAVVSGGAGFLVDQAAEASVDLFLTGEMNHNVYHQARELGLNVVYGGHYATETAGLKALGAHLDERFGLQSLFLDLPTGA